VFDGPMAIGEQNKDLSVKKFKKIIKNRTIIDFFGKITVQG
jgi:hypothetical protein